MGELLLQLEASSTSVSNSGSRAFKQVTTEMEPLVNGTMVLYSAAYPGPGFTGTYDWNGTLKLEPDPFKRLREMYEALEAMADNSSSSVSSGVRKASRMLHEEQDGEENNGREKGNDGCHSEYPFGASCEGDVGSHAASSSRSGGTSTDIGRVTSSSSRRRLQVASDFIDAPVQGRITVREWYLKSSTTQQGVSEVAAASDPLITVAGGPACLQTGTCESPMLQTLDTDTKKKAFKMSLTTLIGVGIGAVVAAGLCIIVAVGGIRRSRQRERARQRAAQAAAGAIAAAGTGAAGTADHEDGTLSSAILPWSGSGAIASHRGSLELARGANTPAGEACRNRHTLSLHGGGGGNVGGFSMRIVT